MIDSLLLGCGFAFGAAVQPGPLQAFLLSRVAAAGWRRTLPACLAPLLSDGPIAFVAIFVLGRLTQTAQHMLRASGGALLIYLAWTAYRQWRTVKWPSSQVSAPRTFVEAALVNTLNPNPYLGWTLVLGPSFVTAWRSHPAYAVVLVAAFYVTMVAVLGAFVFLAGTARFLGPKWQRALVWVSALILAVLGTMLLVSSAWQFWGGLVLH